MERKATAVNKVIANPITTHISAIALSVLYFLLHLHFMQQFLNWDQIIYSSNIIRSCEKGSIILLNAHHLHMEPGNVLFHSIISKELGIDDPVFNSRLRALITACAGIYFCVLFIKNATGRISWGLACATLAGVCLGFMTYSTRVDTGIYPASGMLATLWIFERIGACEKYTKARCLLAGLILALDILFHQYMGIAALLFCLCLLIPPGFFRKARDSTPFELSNSPKPAPDRIAVRLSRAAIVAVTCLLAAGAAYFYIGRVLLEHPFAYPFEKRKYYGVTFQRWLFSYARSSEWGYGFRQFDPGSPFWGYTEAFLSQADRRDWKKEGYDFNYRFSDLLSPNHIVHNLAALFTLFAFAGSMALAGLLRRRYGGTFIFIFLLLVSFSLFATYWEPSYLEFWIIPCTLVCILGILIFNALGEKMSLLLPWFSQALLISVVLFFVFSLASHNIRYSLIPFSQKKVLWSYNTDWGEDEIKKLFSASIYKNPDSPYAEILRETKTKRYYRHYQGKYIHH